MMRMDQIELKRGTHGPTFKGDCGAMELANLIAAKRVIAPAELLRSDRPLEAVRFCDDHPSVSRVIRGFVNGLNDALDDATRQALKPYAAKILCTASGDADEETRGWMAMDWLVRVHAPAFLRLAGLGEHASALEGLARITDAATARAAQPTLNAARKAATAAASAAGVAVWNAAWVSTAIAAGDTAKAAAAVAPRAAGLDAAMAAAKAAEGTAAGAAAMAAAWAASRAAAGVAARNAAGAASGAAAGAAAESAFAEIVPALQASALELLDDMIAVGRS